MSSNKLNETYRAHVAALERRLEADKALRLAVGGEFIAVGKMVYHLLRYLGMTDGQLIVDVGCGSGRLAVQLAPFNGIHYIGCDIVDSLLSAGGGSVGQVSTTEVPGAGSLRVVYARDPDGNILELQHWS